MRSRTQEHKDMIQVWTAIVLRGILVLLALLALFFYVVPWLYDALKTILLMLIVSIFFCYLIAPLVRVFEQPVYVLGREIKLPRVGAICVVYLIIGLATFAVAYLLLPVLWTQLSELARNSPTYANEVVAWFRQTLGDANVWMRQLKLPTDVRNKILQQVEKIAEESSPRLGSVISGIFGSLAYVLWLVLIPIFSFFLLKDADRFTRGAAALMPSERLQKRVYWMLLDVSRTLAAYIRAQITACVVVFVLMTTGLWILGAPYPVVLGVLAGILEFVPMVGPLVAAAITVGLTLTKSTSLALGVAIFLAVLRLVQDYVIYPKIVGQGIKMHPLAVVLAILCGEKIGGLVGIFLAIPLVGSIIVFYNHYMAYRTLSASAAAAEAAKAQHVTPAHPPPSPPEPVFASQTAGETAAPEPTS